MVGLLGVSPVMAHTRLAMSEMRESAALPAVYVSAGQDPEGVAAMLELGKAPGSAVWLYLDATQPWASTLWRDQDFEVVGLLMGAQEVEQYEAPVIRVVWLRPAN